MIRHIPNGGLRLLCRFDRLDEAEEVSIQVTDCLSSLSVLLVNINDIYMQQKQSP